MRKAALIFAAVAHLLLLDAATKEFAIRVLRGADPIRVAPGFFNLAYVENRGCAWGMCQGHVWPLAVFAVAVTAFLVWKRREFFSVGERGWRGKTGAAAECLMYAGVAGNFIDRVFRGCVIDFLDFQFGSWHFPCFNVADVCITFAVGLMCLAAFAANPDAAADAAKANGGKSA